MNEPYAFEEPSCLRSRRAVACSVLGVIFCMGFTLGFVALGGPKLIGIGRDHPAPTALAPFTSLNAG